MRFEEFYERRQRRTLTMAEAAEILGITERTFRRWSGRYATEGAEGLQDRRIDRAAARAVPVDDARRLVTRGETRSTYAGRSCTASPAHLIRRNIPWKASISARTNHV
jgi:hypothetical protein